MYAALPAHGVVLFEFPVHQPADRFSENLPYMYFSIWHWRPMVNGYSGFIPASTKRCSQAFRHFPMLRRCSFFAPPGLRTSPLHCRLWELSVCVRTMVRLDATAGVRRIARADWYGVPSSLYELDPVSAIPDPGSGMWAAR